MRRSERLLRAAAAACLSTGVALAMHVAGGGAVPAGPGLLVPLALAFAVSLQLAGVALSRWRLGLAVIASQALFHGSFAFGAGGSLSVAGSGPHAGHDPSSLVLDASSVAVAHHHHGGGSAMLAAHLVAALATYLVLRRADVLLAWGARLVASLLARLRVAPSLPALAFRPLARPSSTPARRSRICSSPRVLRGPPLSLA